MAPLQSKQPGFYADEVGLELGRAYAASGRQEDARAQYERVVERSGDLEARIELALWALENDQETVAQRELKEIEHARSLNQALFKRLDAATPPQGLCD